MEIGGKVNEFTEDFITHFILQQNNERISMSFKYQ